MISYLIYAYPQIALLGALFLVCLGLYLIFFYE